jgi:hypothetical protein
MNAALLLVALAVPSANTPGRAALSGVVRTDTGQPIRGASVFIRTAKPRVGVGDL